MSPVYYYDRLFIKDLRELLEERLLPHSHLKLKDDLKDAVVADDRDTSIGAIARRANMDMRDLKKEDRGKSFTYDEIIRKFRVARRVAKLLGFFNKNSPNNPDDRKRLADAKTLINSYSPGNRTSSYTDYCKQRDDQTRSGPSLPYGQPSIPPRKDDSPTTSANKVKFWIADLSTWKRDRLQPQVMGLRQRYEGPHELKAIGSDDQLRQKVLQDWISLEPEMEVLDLSKELNELYKQRDGCSGSEVKELRSKILRGIVTKVDNFAKEKEGKSMNGSDSALFVARTGLPYATTHREAVHPETSSRKRPSQNDPDSIDEPPSKNRKTTTTSRMDAPLASKTGQSSTHSSAIPIAKPTGEAPKVSEAPKAKKK